MLELLKSILEKLADAAKGFVHPFSSEQELDAFLFQYGWNIQVSEENFSRISQVFGLTRFPEWIEQIEELSNIQSQEENYPEAVAKIIALGQEIFGAIIQIGSSIDTSLPFPFSEQVFWQEIKERLLDDFVVVLIKKQAPLTLALFHLFGIVQFIEEEPEGEGRINYTRTDIQWGKLTQFLGGPVDLFKEVYQWDQEGGAFQWAKLLHALEYAFLVNRFLVRYTLPRKSIVEAFSDPEYAYQQKIDELHIPFIYGASILDQSFYNIGFALMPIGRDGLQGPPDGLLITPHLEGDLSLNFWVTPNIRLHLDTAINADHVLGVKLYPDGVEIATNGAATELAAVISMEGAPRRPWIIAGTRDSHRLELHGFEFYFMVAGKVDDPEVKIGFTTKSADPAGKGVHAVIQMEESDSFVQETTKSNNIEAWFDTEIVWSNKTGFTFGGSFGFDLELQLNQKLGPIEITRLHFNIGEGAQVTSHKSVSLHTGVGFKGELGPVKFVVEDIGFSMDFIPYSHQDLRALPPDADPPLLGLLDLDFGYAGPKGLGFTIDARSVKGGGYLEFNDGEYIGFAELTVLDKFTVKAIGVITTKLPDGQPGYSFLLLITAEFEPIQLGFGFTLEGVGGIIGLHRSLNLETIREKVKTDDYDHILFPEDPLGNLPEIISSINEILPIKQGSYSFGIMGRLGWGTPKLIDIKAGFLFEVPRWKIAVVGMAKSEITKTRAPENEGEEPEAITLLLIQVNFAATYDPEKALFAFDASLYKSEILGMKLEGDAFIRLRGGNDPYFMVSIGGFHPEFSPPQGLELPQKADRIKLTIKDDNPNIYAQFYFAVTSNTIQFGAEATALYEGWGFSIDGTLGFDALFQVNPLYFTVHAWGGVTIYVWGGSWGLRVDGTITGPYPFTFALSVTIDLWLCDVTFNIPQFSIGKSAQSTLPTVAVLPILLESLQDIRSWQPLLPQQVLLLVSTRSLEADTPEDEEQDQQTLTVHPVGTLGIDQSVVPLGIAIERFGDHRPSDFKEFALYFTDQEGNRLEQERLEQFFAPSQFFDMEKEEKFNRKSYEKMPSGIKLSGLNRVTGGNVLEKDVRYETKLYDPERAPDTIAGKDVLADNRRFFQGALNNSVANSALGKKLDRIKKSQKEFIRLEQEEFAIVFSDSLSGFEQKKAGSEAEARRMLDEILKGNPELEQQLEVVPIFETI